jgi:asparagine synthetase B (glutamine-hydrolysing)
MCGIYGITAKDPKFIKDFIEICKHRGPDGESVWESDTVTLGHNLLSIMASPDPQGQHACVQRRDIQLLRTKRKI